MKTTVKYLAILLVTAFLSVESSQTALALSPQTICPVMGNPINKNLFVDYNGKRVYFCCGPCPTNFMKHPEAYLQRLVSVGQEPIDTPKTK